MLCLGTIRRIAGLGLMVGSALAGGPGAASDSWPEAYRAPATPPDESAPVTPVTEPTGPLAARQAMALALMHNPELAVFSWDVRAAEARMLQAGVIANPELDLRVYRLGIPRNRVGVDQTRSRVVLSQEFELGGKRARRLEVADRERELASWEYESQRIEVATLVSSRFAAVLGAQRRVQSSRDLVAFLQRTRDRVAGLVEVGNLRELELHQVTRQAALARIDQKQAEAALATARFRLAATWGSQAPEFGEAVGELERVASLPDLEAVIAMARESPSIQRWDAELARGKAALGLARAGRVPDISYGAGIRWESDFDQRDYLIDFEISLPIFDHKKGDALEARYRMARAQAGRESAAAAASEAIAEFYFLADEAASRSKTIADEVLPAARAAFEAYRPVLDGQPEFLGDLIDARRDLGRTENQLSDALVDFHQALAALEGVVGQDLGGDP